MDRHGKINHRRMQACASGKREVCPGAATVALCGRRGRFSLNLRRRKAAAEAKDKRSTLTLTLTQNDTNAFVDMPKKQIFYSDKYTDEEFEYRWVNSCLFGDLLHSCTLLPR